MKNSLIFCITNDDITIAAGRYYKGKPVLLSVKSKRYDGLLDNSEKPIETSYLIKEIKTILDSMFKKVPTFDEVQVVLPDLKVDSYISSMTVYTRNEASVVTDVEINNLFLDASKKNIDGANLKIIDVTPIYFEIDKQQFNEPPIGKPASNIKMLYSCYPIDINIYRSMEKIFNKLGFKNITLTLNSVELVNLIKSSKDYPKAYFLLDSGYTNSYYSIVGSNVVLYNEHLSFSIFNLLEEFVHEYDIPYSDARQIVLNYGYDKEPHPIKVLLYKGVNRLGVEVKIFQHDLNKKIDDFILNLVRNIEEKEVLLKNLAKVAENIELPIIGLGEFFEINGFIDRFEEISGKKIKMFENKFSYHKERNIYSILGVLNKIETYDFKDIVANDNISTVTRGE